MNEQPGTSSVGGPEPGGPEPGPDQLSSEAVHAYRIHAGQFEGPLDLLLHLVRANEVEITDIPIVEITDQYQAHLEMMQEMNLEIAGEYLVMAATLMHIKSRVLLPPDPDASAEDDADPRAELTQQLLDYQRFKQAAENLQAMDSRRSLIWNRDSVPDEFAGEELLSVDLFDLLKAFRGLLGRLGEEARIKLRRDTVSVAEKIAWLEDLLTRRSSIVLLELLADLPTRLDRIAAFLAVLEMVRLQMIVVFQRKLFGEIRIANAPERPAEPVEKLEAEGEPPEAGAETPGDVPETSMASVEEAPEDSAAEAQPAVEAAPAEDVGSDQGSGPEEEHTS